MRNRLLNAVAAALPVVLLPLLAGAQEIPAPSSITQIAPSSQIAGPAPRQMRTGVLAVTDNTRVNSNPPTLERPQVEPSVASNPSDPTQLVAGFADSQAGPVNFDFAPGVARSTDGSQTWLAPGGGPVLPDPPGFTWGNRAVSTSLAAGDSAVAWGIGQTVYASTLGSMTIATRPAVIALQAGYTFTARMTVATRGLFPPMVQQ
jgi:hypothetical protein